MPPCRRRGPCPLASPRAVVLACISALVALCGGPASAASVYSLESEEAVRWYRNPKNLDVFDDVFELPPTGLLMPEVEASQHHMMKYVLEGGMGRCLDGSNPVYYMAFGEQSTKWMIFLEGGDWCTRYENTGDKDMRRNCLERRFKTGLQGGTTTEDPEQLSMASVGNDYGQFSRDLERNPLMHDWNKVFIRNCDGSSFTSARTDVKKVGEEHIFFRGWHNLKEALADLTDKHYLGYATDVVVAGCSAGGLGVYLHTDYVQSVVVEEAKRIARDDLGELRVVGLADSGFFLHHAGGPGDCNYIQRMQFVYNEMDVTEGLQPACLAAFGNGNKYKCLFAETAIHFAKAPIFTMQSVVDGWQLEWIGCDAADDQKAVDWYANEMWGALLLANKNPKNGAFVDGCQHHCHCHENIFIDGLNQGDAFQRFYNGVGGQKQWWSQECAVEMGGECPLKTE